MNGTIVARADALIPITDRGFRFGDSLFETMRLVNGRVYQLPLHEERLKAGLAALKFPPISFTLADEIDRLLAANHHNNGFLRLQVSRGQQSMGYRPGPECVPHFVLEYMKAPSHIIHPLKLHVASNRRMPLSVLPGNFKLGHGLGSALALMESKEAGCDEALILSTDGLLCEAAAGNLFWIKDETLYTPSLATGCLSGTTRSAVMRLCPYPIIEGLFDMVHLEQAEGVFLTNCRYGLRLVSAIPALGWSWPEHILFSELTRLYLADLNDESTRS